MSELSRVARNDANSIRDLVDSLQVSTSDLRSYLNNHEFECESGKSNIVDLMHIGGRGMHLIPDNRLFGFFDELDRARKDGVKMMFGEVRTNRFAGILIDFDIYQDSNTSQLDKHMLQALALDTITSIATVVDLDRPVHGTTNNVFHVIYTKKPQLVWSDEHNAYKDGIHMLIPSIQLNGETRKLVHQKLLSYGIYDDIVDAVGVDAVEDIVDGNSPHVTTYFLGCLSKPSASVPYNLHAAYQVTFRNKRNPIIEEVTDAFEEDNVNLSLELSLNWGDRDGIIKKRHYVVAEQYADELKQFMKEEEPVADLDIHGVMSLNRIHDPEFMFIRELVCLLDRERAVDTKQWMYVMKILASCSTNYESIAREFSMRCPEKYNAKDFATHWKHCVDTRGDRKFTIANLIALAKDDDPERFIDISRKNIGSQIYHEIRYGTQPGNLNDFAVAKILYMCLRHKFMYDAKLRSWYEFMTELDEDVKLGELYKYRVYDATVMPEKIVIYITDVLTAIMETHRIRLYKSIGEVKANSSLQKTLKNIYKRLGSTIHTMGMVGKVLSICTAAKFRFGVYDCGSEMDKDRSVLGVGNGVIQFIDAPLYMTKFIRGVHGRQLTKFTPVNFKPFNPRDKYIREMLCLIKSMFMDNNHESFMFLLYLLGYIMGPMTSTYLVMFHGAGRNAKTSLIELVMSMMGQYSTKLNSVMFTTKSNVSEGASPVTATIEHCRMVAVSETGRGEVLNTSRIKEWLGKERLQCRELYQKSKIIYPDLCIFLATNNLPVEKEHDEGAWRRKLVFDMVIKFCEAHAFDEDDPTHRPINKSVESWKNDPDRLSALLSIALYFRQLLHDNYEGNIENVPHKYVMNSTLKYRNTQDKINEFITDKIIHSHGHIIYMDDLCAKYTIWLDHKYPENKNVGGLDEDFERSALGKLFDKPGHNRAKGKCLKNMRILNPDDVLDEDERYFIEVKDIEDEDTPIVTKEEMLQQIEEMFEKNSFRMGNDAYELTQLERERLRAIHSRNALRRHTDALPHEDADIDMPAHLDEFAVNPYGDLEDDDYDDDYLDNLDDLE
jgi:phage/plasmid-associated DNA primase